MSRLKAAWAISYSILLLQGCSPASMQDGPGLEDDTDSKRSAVVTSGGSQEEEGEADSQEEEAAPETSPTPSESASPSPSPSESPSPSPSASSSSSDAVSIVCDPGLYVQEIMIFTDTRGITNLGIDCGTSKYQSQDEEDKEFNRVSAYPQAFPTGGMAGLNGAWARGAAKSFADFRAWPKPDEPFICFRCT